MDLVWSLPDRLGDIAPWRWAVALLCTLVSFWGVAQYDAHAHRALGTGISTERARISGAVGVALGQTVGFGVITGAIARWRVLSDLSAAQALRISVFVSVSFVMCWAYVTALACLALPAPVWTFWPALTVLASLPFVAAILFLFPVIRGFGEHVHLPSLRISGAVLFWASVDTGLAACALFVLLPGDVIGFGTFFPLFLIALGTGLISNTPGGVGPFELVLLSAVPLDDPTPILAAILGYRIVYYAVPAVCAAFALLRPIGPNWAPQPVTQPVSKPTGRGEVAVVTQNGGRIARLGDSAVALWPTGQTVIQFCDPVTGTPAQALDHLTRAAAQAGKLAMIYKCNARTAHAARNANWRVLHLADEALIDLRSFDLQTSNRSGLRRKLRAAAKAGLICRSGQPLPDAAMARVDAEWQAAHGTARGGSMGRYCPVYVAKQWVGCAYLNGRLVGFVTAHKGRDEWCLDIMRQASDAPDGTMHALVQSAITAAHNAGARRFSLAAVPACPDPASALWRKFAYHIATKAGSAGLRQFKSAFAPRWEPRYAAARSWGGLALGLADIARAIHSPAPIVPGNTNQPHNLDENYELASTKAA